MDAVYTVALGGKAVGAQADIVALNRVGIGAAFEIDAALAKPIDR